MSEKYKFQKVFDSSDLSNELEEEFIVDIELNPNSYIHFKMPYEDYVYELIKDGQKYYDLFNELFELGARYGEDVLILF